ncbi:hypothetical protein AKJ09_03352 [Labilithrix luteola]|uniref:Uncharacterized protein n=1 Tax=Labilithrix luteola TaxID=1391654 RepID=A0A0K1PT26_9BACT|nr:hypothetical protein [Labilithrix luteola]AKU96688.1 hypothetical protein AKJ09_03352 [Labilithrix luteola]
MRRVALVSVFACACGAIAVDPPSEQAPDRADAAVDSGIGQAPAPEPRPDCRPAPDAVESALPVAIPPGVTADFAVEGWRPVVAVTPNGDAVVAWHNADHVRVRLYRDSHWLDVETITSPDSQFAHGDQTPRVAMRPDGTVVAAYYERATTSHDVVCTRERSSNGTWSPVSTLAVTGIGWWQEPSPPAFELAADGAGNVTALVDADRENGGLLAFRAPAGGGFGDPSFLTAEALGNFTFAVDASGKALAVWSEGAAGSGLVKAAAFSPATGWGATDSLGLGDVGLSVGLSATPDRDGSMSVLGGRLFEDGGTRVQTTTRERDGGWNAPTELADFPPFGRIASDGAGRAMVAGSNWSSECTFKSGVVRRDASGKWGGAESIPGAAPDRTVIRDIALSQSGHGLVEWELRKPSSGVGCLSDGAYLSWLSPEGAWLPAMLLDSQEGESEATFALTPSGRALVAWSHGDLVLVRWIDPP